MVLIHSLYATSPLPRISEKNQLGFLVVVILSGDSPTNQKDLLVPHPGKVVVTSRPHDEGTTTFTIYD
jgi:hypothetical protein